MRLLEEYKPGRRLQNNVEFYTALLLHVIGIDVALFTPTFAISRVSGWIAHAMEQRRANRIIRPQSVYTGPRDQKWVPIAEGGPIAATSHRNHEAHEGHEAHEEETSFSRDSSRLRS